MPVEPKVVIENRVLPGLSDTRSLQPIATVYIGTEEYRVYAPPKATGNSLEWLDSSRVHTPTQHGENVASESESREIINLVRNKLQAASRVPKAASKTENDMYYHVRFHVQGTKLVEVRFDLTLSSLEQRVLEPYREMRPIVMNGRTILVQELERIEVYKSSKPSSEFDPFIAELARHPRDDWFFGQTDIKNVTDELIQTPSIDALPQKADAIELLCFKFHEVTKQLRKRRDNRSTLDVSDEYDVQDLLHALLRIFFDDVRPEEWTPSYAGKSARMDFLRPKVETVVEAKKTRQGLGTKEVGDELIIDISRYKRHPSCKRLICFVYDPEGRISNPRGIQDDLSQKQGELDVKVIIEPQN